MKVIVTSGGTREYIDEMRFITNVSTGKLGARIAEALQFTLTEGPNRPESLEITYIHTDSAAMPLGVMPNAFHRSCRFNAVLASTTAQMHDALQELVPTTDVVIQCAAISDFGFTRDTKSKLSSHDPEGFIDYLRDHIVVNLKLITFIKEWNPNCKLVGFKFETGKTEEELWSIAQNSLRMWNADLVVANDKAMMQQQNAHVAYFVKPTGTPTKVVGKGEIAYRLAAEVKKWS